MIPEIWSATDNFFVILDHFCPFTLPPPPPPPNQPEKPKFWKWKKCMEMWRYHYFIQMYHKSWYATLFLIYNDRFNSYFYFWAIFFFFFHPPPPPPPLLLLKILSSILLLILELPQKHWNHIHNKTNLEFDVFSVWKNLYNCMP